jgi:protein tyrosine/serine phosphatase
MKSLALIAVLSFGTVHFARAGELTLAAMDIPEFHAVSEGIFRGAHPEQSGLEDLAKLGVKTIIDLENDGSDEIELPAGRALGMQVIVRPMSTFWAPSDEQANEILSMLANPALRPLFIHCTYGQDRTGLMIGLYRVLYEKLNAADAYAEMLGYGFKNHLLFPLDGYFRARTQFND